MKTHELKRCLIAFYNDAMAIYSKSDTEQLLFAMPRTIREGKHKGETVNDAKSFFETDLPLVLVIRLIDAFENKYNELFSRTTGKVEFLGEVDD